MVLLNLVVQTSSRSWQSRSGKKATWHRVVSFDPQVIARSRSLTNGDMLAARGCLERRICDSNGRTGFIIEIVAEELDLIPTAAGRDTNCSCKDEDYRFTLVLI